VKLSSVPDKVGLVNQKKLGALIAAMAVSIEATVLYVPAVGSTLPAKSNSKMVPTPVPVEAATAATARRSDRAGASKSTTTSTTQAAISVSR